MDASFNGFSHSEYRQILGMYQEKIKDFNDVLNENAQEFVLLRHDVEFSVLRALEVAQIENEHDVCSTFNFQVLAHTYNLFSNINIERVRLIASLGHKIGLHFYHSHIRDHDWGALEDEFRRQMNLLSQGISSESDRFSFHRPKAWMLELRSDYLFDSINQYGPSFFEHSASPKNILYLADSRHEWSYGHPLKVKPGKMIQMLTHPDEWTRKGLSEVDNFKSLLDELEDESRATFLLESPKNYTKYIGRL